MTITMGKLRPEELDINKPDFCEIKIRFLKFEAKQLFCLLVAEEIAN